MAPVTSAVWAVALAGRRLGENAPADIASDVFDRHALGHVEGVLQRALDRDDAEIGHSQKRQQVEVVFRQRVVNDPPLQFEIGHRKRRNDHRQHADDDLLRAAGFPDIGVE